MNVLIIPYLIKISREREEKITLHGRLTEESIHDQ
jgi:hypothetical protein